MSAMHRLYPRLIRVSQLLSTILVVTFFLAPIGCDEGPDSENAIQKSLDTLLYDLQVATSGNSIQNIEAVISSANRVRPSSQSQKQSKKLLLSAAKEKLTQLKFHTLAARTTLVAGTLQLAQSQAVQVALLRDASDSLLDSATQSGTLLSQEIASAQNSARNHFRTQRTEASSEMSDLDSQSQAAREDAEVLREEANQLLNDAEDQGVVEGFETYKAGAQALRQSQLIDLSAAEIELQASMHAVPMLKEAEAELEAIALVLSGMEDTEDMLDLLRDTTLQNADDFNALADDIDTIAAETMNGAIEVGSALMQEWQDLASLIREAMQGAGRSRGASREAQKTTGIWKLDLEWTLGQIEEARLMFLLEELRAVEAFIEHGIETTSSKWRGLTSSLSAEIEQATSGAISAYENAIQLTNSAGTQSTGFIHQLERRLAILKGEDVQLPQHTDANHQPNSSTSTNTASRGSGYATPQELAEAFNASISFSAKDITEPINILKFFASEGPDAGKFVAFLNNALGATSNVLIAIRENIGEDAMHQFLSKNPMQTGDLIPPIDLSSISIQSDDIATATTTKGEKTTMHRTPNGWIIYLSSDGDHAEMYAMVDNVSVMMNPLMEMMNSVAEKIRNGEITTLAEVNAAGDAFMEDFNPF